MSTFSSQLEINRFNKVLIHQGFGHHPAPLQNEECGDQQGNRKNGNLNTLLPARRGLERIASSHEGFNLKFSRATILLQAGKPTGQLSVSPLSGCFQRWRQKEQAAKKETTKPK